MAVRAVIIALLALAIAATALRAPVASDRKKLAGPPSEFAQFELPAPLAQAQDASSAFIDITLSLDSDGAWSWTGPVSIDSNKLFAVGLFAKNEESFDLVIETPFATAAPIKEVGPYGIDGDTYPFTTWRWTSPVPGTYNIKVKSSADQSKSPKAIIVVYNESPVQLMAHLNTYDLQLDQEIGIVANLYDAIATPRVAGVRPTPIRAASLQAEMDVTFPNGKHVALQMHDDGLHADLGADDGVYAAVLEAVEAGTYSVRTVFKGVTQDGHAFMRSTDHLVNVISPDLTLTGLATASVDTSANLLHFNIDVDSLSSIATKLSSEDGLTVRAYAEVWGTDATGYEYVPIAWIQGMVDPVSMTNNYVLPMQLDLTWVHKAQAQAPFQLRNVWIEERNTNVPYSSRSKIYVESTDKKLMSFRPRAELKNAPITPEMRDGPKPAWLRNSTVSTNAAAPTLFLVHGYCAGSNEFPTSAFTNAVQFTDFKKSRSIDAFSLEITNQANKNGMGDFSIIAHSQGGMASTHLHTYYWSKLQSTNAAGRLVQSVGTPYGGCGYAGSLAGIGGVIGMGCGSNSDLTYDGATLWQRGIPAAKRTDVHFYATQYGTKGYCVWGANMVLYTPNDGTTEVVKSQLSGANNMGLKNDWCHTTDMIYSNQCTDPTRNAEMNKAAAR